MIEQNQRAANGSTWQQVATFIFLERTRAAAYHLPGLCLTDSKLLADTADFFRLKEAFNATVRRLEDRLRRPRGQRRAELHAPGGGGNGQR